MKQWIVSLVLGLTLVGGVGLHPAHAAGPEMYAEVRLTADLDGLSVKQKRMLELFIEACREMDAAFWLQAYGDKQTLLGTIEDPATRRFAEINYGPWDRLGGNAPFVEGVGPRPAGANLYPADMTREEFETAVAQSEQRAAELQGFVQRHPSRRRRSAYGRAVPRSVRGARGSCGDPPDPGRRTGRVTRPQALPPASSRRPDHR